MRRSIRYLLLFLIATSAAYAQSDTIIPNPKAVQLRRIWKVEGAAGGANYGTGSGSVGDVNGDSLGDFAVFAGSRWLVYYGREGGPSTAHVWSSDTSTPDLVQPVVGDFWGTGHRAVGFLQRRNSGGSHYWLHLYRTDSNRLDSTPAVTWDAVNNSDTTRMYPRGIIGADLDNDGDDELIITSPTGRRGSVYFENAETWIFEGGPNFQVDTPTVVLRDPLENSGSGYGRIHALDFDGDGWLDLINVQRYRDAGTQMSIYWGDGRLPDPVRLPDRTVGIRGIEPTFADIDGDAIMDLVCDGMYIWLSGSGKNRRLRAYDLNDADLQRSYGTLDVNVRRLGYLNSKRFEMLGGLTRYADELMILGLCGGNAGPSPLVDAWYSAYADGLAGGVYACSHPLLDVDGDGWDDVLLATPAYPDGVSSRGIAIILAGGTYIPSDDPSSGVRDVAVAGVEHAISIWPNPVTTELNIAWRGDLSSTPHRFEIYDMLGRRIAGGVIDDGSSALWRCDGVAAGSYRLCIFDAQCALIATVPIVRL